MNKVVNVTFYSPDGKDHYYGDVKSVCGIRDGISIKLEETLTGGGKLTTTVSSTLPYLIEEIVEHDGTITI